MSKALKWIFVLAILASTPAFAGSYSCSGDFGSQGELTLTVNGSQLDVRGWYANDEGRQFTVACTGALRGTDSDGKMIFSVSDASCPIGSLRVSQNLVSQGQGTATLIERGDDGSMGGVNFSCKR
jgi:hypothetical protein